MTKKIGKTSENVCKVLVQFETFEDKELFIRLLAASPNYKNILCKNNNDSFDKYAIDEIQTKFFKGILKIRKNCSNFAVLGELGRYPVIYNNWALGVKYWLRLENVSQNTLLNEAYQTSKIENHEFVSNIKSLLSRHGIKNVWLNPSVAHQNFHTQFLKRLKDEYLQLWHSKCNNSSMNKLLCSLKNDYACSKYLNIIKEDSIRTIFTKLRLNINCLNECTGRYNKN